MTADEILLAAWRRGAPQAIVAHGFPRGFWPDVARVAVEMALQQTLKPKIDFRQTSCSFGNWPERVSKLKSLGSIDLEKLEINL